MNATVRPETLYKLYEWRGDLEDRVATVGTSIMTSMLLDSITAQIAAAEEAWKAEINAQMADDADLRFTQECARN